MPRTSVLSTHIGDWLSRVTSTSRRNLVAVTIATLGLVLIPVAYQDYKMFLSYGPGGVPYNVLGWLGVSLVLAPLGSEMFSVDEYDRNPDKRSWLPDDEPIPHREGKRPRVGPHVVPQRQLNQIPGDEMKQKLTTAIRSLYEQNKHLLKVGQSVYEKHTEALFLADSVTGNNPVGEHSVGEISHVHGTSDHSVHVTLAPQDCKKVLLAGWGQRHALDGSRIMKRFGGPGKYLPREYILIYAPRNDAELQTVLRIVRASVGYMANTRDVKSSQES
ncbi:hypothetical protein VTN00DRAFT_9030 [Thermoascus crustaceus]|uniref:uncharacterized protein n=1 Tax=Thermoascus crustaceus TaxID=5088 RepID=UPI003744655F